MTGWWRPAAEGLPVCIVGACGGIGRATARLLVGSGTKLVLIDKDETALGLLARELDAAAHTADFRQTETIGAAMTAAREKTPKIAGLVVASGVVDTTKLASLTLARWDEILRVNLTGVFLTIQAAQSWISDGGAIVTTSSLAASTGGVITGTAYAASKAAIEAMTKSVAQELAYRGIRANCVSPGAIDTPMTAPHPESAKRAYEAAVPLGRYGHADEAAAAICFLLSRGAGYMTGAIVPVNGGIRMV
jgi:3-oxoacyl-[acyl-carrier protein] reductase